jgi:hypothetical protein
MTWEAMDGVPNPLMVLGGGVAGSGYVLKCYLPGTTTSTPIAIDKDGSSPQTSITYNSEGKLEVSGNEIVPHIDITHKWGIFANSTDAAANTPFYMGPFDNIVPSSVEGATLDAALRSDLASESDAAKGSSLVGYLPAGTGAVGMTQQEKNRETVSVFDFFTDAQRADVIARTLSVDVTSAFIAAITHVTGGGKVFCPAGSYLLSNLVIVGASYVTLEGEGEGATILDFTNVASGDALHFGWDLNDGGCQNISVRNLTITDNRVTSLADSLLKFSGGPGGNNPSTVTGFLTVSNVELKQFNNLTGDAFVTDGISHLNATLLQCGFDLGCRYGYYCTATEDVNSGVNSYDACVFIGQVSGMYIHGQGQLLDSYAFNGCGFFNSDNSDARAAIWIRGQGAAIASLSFDACHLEARNNNPSSPDQHGVLFEGFLYGVTWNGLHLSAGASVSPQAAVAFRFQTDRITGTGEIKAFSFDGLEILRLASTGVAFRFDNDLTMDPNTPVNISGPFFNSTTPDIVEYEAGGNEDNIRNSVIIDSERDVRPFEDVADDTVVSFVPRFSQGTIGIRVNNFDDHTGSVAYRARGTGASSSINYGGANLEVGTGIPTGTTGTDGAVTIFTHTDLKIYIENRTNFTINLQTTLSDFYLSED